MSTHYNFAEFALCNALVKLFQQNLESTFMVVNSLESRPDELTYPCVFVGPVEANEAAWHTATMDVIVQVGVATRIEMPLADHISAVGEVLDLIYNDDCVTELNSLAEDGLVVQRYEAGMRNTDTDDVGRRTMQRVLYLCSMDG